MLGKEYSLIERREIPDSGITGLWFRHACGMEVVSIECGDAENMFCIGLATTPENDCGTSHIIEHSVLAGSARYPVRDPFMEMIKSSVATFINALTYHDHTIYPVASTVPKDFYNLASVYFDAVFNPLLSRQSFLQEGWHYEFEKAGDTASRLQRNGVVLNEMKGAMSDIDEIIEVEVNRRLFPETSRRFLSGGHPDKIGGLTYAKYRSFYQRHYHPSLARVYFYGSIPTDEKLSFLSGLLSGLPATPCPPPLPPRAHQTRWTKPRRATVRYTPPLDESDGRNGAWAQAFYLTDDWEPLTDMAFEFIDEMLFGNDSSPLRQAIQESGLCESLAVSGYDNETLDTAFLIAANGVPKENFPKLERLVQECLLDVAAHGFSEKQLRASVTQFKIARKEVTSSYVYRKMESVFDVWCYGKNPFMYLDGNDVFSRFENKLKSEPTWLQGLIRRFLCDNPHRLTLQLVPDMSLEMRREAAAVRSLESIREKMSLRTRRRIDSDAQELKRLQGTPNSAEALATLPKLDRSEVPDKPALVKYSQSRLSNGIPLLDIDCFTNGLSYFEIMLPLGTMNQEQLPLVNTLYRTLFRRVGTTIHSHGDLDEALAVNGGVIACNKIYWQDNNALNGGLCFLIRALDENFQSLLDLLRECLQHTVFTETTHIRNKLRQFNATVRENIAQGGLSFATIRSGMGLSPLASLREYSAGLDTIAKLKETSAKFRGKWPNIRTGLEEIAAKVAVLTPSLALFEGSERTRDMAIDFLQAFHDGMQGSVLSLDRLESGSGRREGLSCGNDVSTFVRTFKGPEFTDDDSVPLAVYLNMLSCGHLYEEVRLRGGAYDVDCNYEAITGLISIYSGRDPQPWHTMQVFDRLRKVGGFTEEDVGKAVLSTIKGGFAQPRADNSLTVVLGRHLAGITREDEISRFQRCMSLTLKDVTEAAERFWNGNPPFNDCMLGPAKALKKAKIESLKL
ncbi:MAG: insulinase family protein [Victivallales bacterium]|nr:insulinase family protein [Victivallales bacterium]